MRILSMWHPLSRPNWVPPEHLRMSAFSMSPRLLMRVWLSALCATSAMSSLASWWMAGDLVSLVLVSVAELYGDHVELESVGGSHSLNDSESKQMLLICRDDAHFASRIDYRS